MALPKSRDLRFRIRPVVILATGAVSAPPSVSFVSIRISSARYANETLGEDDLPWARRVSCSCVTSAATP